MMKWIRWQGLIAFLVVVALIALLWIVFLDRIVEGILERAGTRAVGAKVEIGSTDVTLFPAGIKIERLQVTDPDSPMTNAVDIAQVDLSIDTAGLVQRKVIVQQMTMAGLRLNTPREYSGAITPPKDGGKHPKEPGPEAGETTGKVLEKIGCGQIDLPSFEKPDLEEILAREKLTSLTLARQVSTDIENAQKEWQEKLADLPDRKQFEAYRTRIDSLSGKTKGLNAILGAAEDVAKLRKDIQGDIEKVKAAEKQFKKRLNQLTTESKRLAKAPQADLAHLKDKYTISAQGLANLSQLIFGQRFCSWIETGLQWYYRLKPYLAKVSLPKGEKEAPAAEPERGRGIDVRFAEHHPLPDFWVRLAKVDAELKSGKLSGKLQDVTSDPPIVGAPLRFQFLGRDMPQIGALNVDGVIDHVHPDRPTQRVDLKINDLSIRDLALSGDPRLPVVMAKGNAQVALNLQTTPQKVNGHLDAQMNAVDFKSQLPDDAGQVPQAIANSLAQVNRFQVQADLKGKTDDYDLTIHSDLDRQLKSSIGRMVQNETDRLTAGLQKEIKRRTRGPIREAGKKLQGLGPVGDELKSRISLGDELLKNLKVKLPF